MRITRAKTRGFTLVELMIALAVGLTVLGAALTLYRKAVDGTFLTTQRTEMQLEVRAAETMLQKDISMAGSGLMPGGVGLPSGTSKTAKYGCDSTKCYVGSSGQAYPGNYMYWIVPGHSVGATLNATAGATDAITVVSGDTGFLLNSYNVSLNSSGTVATFTLPSPAPALTPQGVSDSAVGLRAGDLVLFTGKVGGNTKTGIGQVTANVTGTSSPYTANFSDPDSLGFNQSAATAGSMKQLVGGTGITATRINVVTYYIDVLADPSGSGVGTPRLMRQVNGQAAVPVAENIADLRFSYDLYDDTGTLHLAQGDATTCSGCSPNVIRKVNIEHLTARSAAHGALGYQSLDIQADVSVRNMSFKDRYQ
jgi:prepilin-type N-terminal cleavage/methylation domain-containing protein